MSAPAARRPDVWYRTAARARSKPCDACGQPVNPDEPIAYRRPSSGPRTSDLLHATCAEREPFVDEHGRETGRSIWDEAQQASTPEARGQASLVPAATAAGRAAAEPDPEPTRDELLTTHLADELAALAAVEEALGAWLEGGQDLLAAVRGYRLAAARTLRVRRLDDAAE